MSVDVPNGSLLAVELIIFGLTACACAAQTPPNNDDIVVVARRGHCDLSVAKRIISDVEFRVQAKEWAAGNRLRIHVPVASDYQCKAKIMFKLNRYGVKNAVFIDDGF